MNPAFQPFVARHLPHIARHTKSKLATVSFAPKPPVLKVNHTESHWITVNKGGRGGLASVSSVSVLRLPTSGIGPQGESRQMKDTQGQVSDIRHPASDLRFANPFQPVPG